MTRVQSPAIGNALRTALDLDAAGGMPLTADTTIVPVAVVADVRELLTSKFIPVQHGNNIVLAAGEYSYSILEWVPNALPKPKRLIIDSVRVTAQVSTALVLGFMIGGVAGPVPDGLPRRKVGSLQASAVAGRVIAGPSITDPLMSMDYAGHIAISANSPLEIQFREPIILDGEGQQFAVAFTTVNIGLRAHWQWREER